MAETLSEVESDIKQDVSKKGPVCEISSSVLVASEALSQRRMQLTVPNALPGYDVWLGNNDDDKSFLIVFWEIFAGMNNVNLPVYHCIITRCPHLVETYKQFDDRDTI